jgi:hypothetical protein
MSSSCSGVIDANHRLLKQPGQIPASVHYPYNGDASTHDPVENQVLSARETPQSDCYVFARSARTRVPAQELELFVELLDQPAGSRFAILGDVCPNPLDIPSRAPRQAVSLQSWPVSRSARASLISSSASVLIVSSS